jgi:hypothetical protein
MRCPHCDGDLKLVPVLGEIERDLRAVRASPVIKFDKHGKPMLPRENSTIPRSETPAA